LTNQQHIDFVQCTFARADTWALWQDSFPEDKPMESLLDILKLGSVDIVTWRSSRRR
jgi:cellulose synthase (UDP-forming)